VSSDHATLLETAPHPLLTELLYEPGLREDLAHVLPYLLSIDAAHVAMLVRRQLLSARTGALLLRVNRTLTERHAAGDAVLRDSGVRRGLYLVLEHHYAEALGADVGGAGHLGRSRNDINATVTRMRLRDRLLDLQHEWVALARAIDEVARRHVDTIVSGFTHAQPAQPTTLAHYLAGVQAELLRGASWLARVYEDVDRCPMGAAAGFGTPVAIDRKQVADLLGFQAPVSNALDAVASRDYGIQALAALAALASTSSRLSVDLQTWSSRAYGFLGWPDGLVSTSSIMPQKRNAFVLEHIRGAAAETTAAMVAMLTGLKNTPFANSVEVSAETTSHLWPACDSVRNALRLTTLLIVHLIADAPRMRAFLDREETTTTALADWLVSRYAIPFRTAHTMVSRVVAECPARPFQAADVCHVLRRLTVAEAGHAIEIGEAEVEDVLRVETCVRDARFGGGPAPSSVEAQLDEMRRAIDSIDQVTSARRRHLARAAEHLAEETARLAGTLAGEPAR
jgi:argininosuccinate lyase